MFDRMDLMNLQSVSVMNVWQRAGLSLSYPNGES